MLLSLLAGSTLLAIASKPTSANETHWAGSASEAVRCESLAETDFSNLHDAATQISTANLVVAVGELLGDLGWPELDALRDLAVKHAGSVQPYCRVRGYVTSNVGFELLLPVSHWNGKFLQVGCGGWCGTTGYVGLSCVLHPGYACISTDMGHTGAGGVWFRSNLQGQIDFSYRATHVTALAGKAVTEHYYSKKPERSYFLGCSTGGYQGMVEVQRFPWDFDGIVAGAPDMDESDLAARGIWIKQSFLGHGAKPLLTPGQIRRVHQAALSRCDLDDGVRDGIISDPVHCKFDPADLLCKADSRGAEADCLTAQQVQAVKNIYGAPVNSKGIALSTRGVFPGSENLWSEEFAETWGDEYFKATELVSEPGKHWNYADFDFDRDYARSGVGVVFTDTNPDLRKFKAAGGKLIVYQGGNDVLEIPGAVVDYYETVEKTMGGRSATQDFFRLFVIPGMNHCTGGDGAFAVDYLSYLEQWVEQGKVPDVMIGAHPDGLQKLESWLLKFPLEPDVHVAFTRALYPYPQYAKYIGRGDPNKAENFKPVLPH